MKVTIFRRNGTSITLEGVDTELTLKLAPDGGITLNDEEDCTLALARVESIRAEFRAPSATHSAPLPPLRPLGSGAPTGTTLPRVGDPPKP